MITEGITKTVYYTLLNTDLSVGSVPAAVYKIVQGLSIIGR